LWLFKSGRFEVFPFRTHGTDTPSWGGSNTVAEDKEMEEMLYNIPPNTGKQIAVSSLA